MCYKCQASRLKTKTKPLITLIIMIYMIPIIIAVSNKNYIYPLTQKQKWPTISYQKHMKH